MSEELLEVGLSAKTAALHAMVARVSAEVGLDPAILIAIITAILQMIQNCKKPANQKDVDGLLADVSRNHPDKCPIWLRGCFRDNGVRSLSKVHETWSVIADDAVSNSAAVGVMLVA